MGRRGVGGGEGMEDNRVDGRGGVIVVLPSGDWGPGISTHGIWLVGSKGGHTAHDSVVV